LQVQPDQTLYLPFISMKDI